MAKQREDVHTFASEPREIAARKKPKYRETASVEPGNAGNIMYDKRVIRGNTYAAQPLPQPTLTDTRKPPTTRAAAPTLRLRAPGTPQPVEGRRHMDVQTELYLEELTDAPQESEAAAQTDAFLDRPATPLYVPLKVGADVSTQIELGELFNFDVEVEPLLEVLVGKTMEQALQEVCEEEELAALAAHQAHFEALRNAELAAAQRMETAERRRAEEEVARLAAEAAEAERKLADAAAAETSAAAFLASDPPLVPAEKVEEAKEALGEGATSSAVLEKLVADGVVPQETVVEFVTAKGLGYPPFGVPVPGPPPPEPSPPPPAEEGEGEMPAEAEPPAAE